MLIKKTKKLMNVIPKTNCRYMSCQLSMTKQMQKGKEDQSLVFPG